MTFVAEIRVRRDRVRRPIDTDTFLAVECEDGDVVVRVRGCWHGSTEERRYSWPWTSLDSIRWLDGVSA